MNVHPTKLERIGQDRLKIVWSDNTVRSYSVAELRDACPCATCREKRNAPPPDVTTLPILSPSEAQPLTIESMRPVGNYAYGIDFSDGHNTGIYTFEALRELGSEVPD